jgi:predicted Zn-dependent protease
LRNLSLRFLTMRSGTTSRSVLHNKNLKVKPGGKDDIDAIGSRDIGGRGLGNWYSLETEIRMGREYAQMIDSTVKLVQDPVITEYVNRVGQNIVRNSDSQVPFTHQSN